LPQSRSYAGLRRPALYAGVALLLVSVVLPLLGFGVAPAALLALASLVGIAAVHNVPIAPTAQDEETGRAVMARAGQEPFTRPATFEQEVDLAFAIQQAVFDIAPFEKRDESGKKVPVPLCTPRELSDLVRTGFGLCFDRSRAIETLIRLHGIKARHVNIFSRRDDEPTIRAILRRDSPSHSVTEMETSRGWMLIDSNYRFIAVSSAGEVFGAAALARLPQVQWDSRNTQESPKLVRPFTYVYGLYSRHGRFYPPFSRFPNINWLELSQNLYTPAARR
jgi:hypothetical protein